MEPNETEKEIIQPDQNGDTGEENIKAEIPQFFELHGKVFETYDNSKELEAEKDKAILIEKTTKAPKPPKKEKKAPKKDSRIRNTKTVIFSDQDFAHLDPIVQERMDANLTTSWAQFIKQCIDFTINHKWNEGTLLAIPDNTIEHHLQDGFFGNKFK